MEIRDCVLSIVILTMSTCGSIKAEDFMRDFRSKGVLVQPKVYIVDESDKPISGATVSFLFRTGRGNKTIIKKTNDEGIANAKGRANLDIIIRANLDSYYGIFKPICFSSYTSEKQIIANAMEWKNKGIKIYLKKKIHPHKKPDKHMLFHDIPTNTWVWVNFDARTIHGVAHTQLDLTNGHMRVFFTVVKDDLQGSATSLMAKLQVPASGGGFIFKSRDTESDLHFDNEAPLEGYESEICLWEKKRGGHYVNNLMDPLKTYCFFKVKNCGEMEDTDFRYGIISFFSIGFNQKRGTATLEFSRFFNLVEEANNTEYQ